MSLQIITHEHQANVLLAIEEISRTLHFFNPELARLVLSRVKERLDDEMSWSVSRVESMDKISWTTLKDVVPIAAQAWKLEHHGIIFYNDIGVLIAKRIITPNEIEFWVFDENEKKWNREEQHSDTLE
jgi:hypothetical protein